MKLEDIEVGRRYIFRNDKLPSDEANGTVVTVQSLELDWLFNMVPCINDEGEEGLADPEELFPITEEN